MHFVCGFGVLVVILLINQNASSPFFHFKTLLYYSLFLLRCIGCNSMWLGILS